MGEPCIYEILTCSIYAIMVSFGALPKMFDMSPLAKEAAPCVSRVLAAKLAAFATILWYQGCVTKSFPKLSVMV